MLERCLESVYAQTMPVDIMVRADPHRKGAAATRNAALEEVDTEFVGFLDDDDRLYPQHFEVLHRALENGADVAYPWFDLEYLGYVHNEKDPLRLRGRNVIGQPFDPDALRINNYVPVTTLCRTDTVKKVGGFPMPFAEDWPREDCEDWGLWVRILNAGGKFVHVPERTWRWVHWGGNTSGKGQRSTGW